MVIEVIFPTLVSGPTAGSGFRCFTMDRQTMLADGRGSFRIHFFDTTPADLPLLDWQHPTNVFKETELQNMAFDAIEFGA